jgi:hypothetical protein
MVKLSPIEGLQSRTITSSGGDILTWEISSGTPFNLSKSYLNYTLTGVGLASNYNWLPIDVIASIREVWLQTRGGVILAYLNFADVFTKATMKSETRLEEFLDLDECESASGGFNGLSRSDMAAVSNVRYNNSTPSLSFTEPKYLVVGGLGTNTPVIYNRIPLNMFKNTIFALDKDLIFNETIQLRIVLNSANKIGFTNGSAADPTAATLANIVSITLTNPFLYLQVERNQEVVDGLRAKINSAEGMKVLFDYVYHVRQAFSASTQQSMTVKLNRNNGLTCKKIFYCLTPGTETTNAVYDISNINGSKCTSFYDSLNNIRLVDYNLSCATADREDYMLLREYLKGSTVQTSDIYYYNWCFVRNFCDVVPKIEEVPENQNKLQGLDLRDEQKYDMFLNTVNSAFNHYAFIVCQKVLHVSSAGIVVM